VTLAALALGYFLGGYLADRYTRNMLLFSVLAVGSVLLALMPNLAKFSLEATSGMGIRTGSLVSALVFLLPPLVCLGMSSPVIIRLAKVFFHLSMLPLPPSAESRA
jgi:MFS family permease